MNKKLPNATAILVLGILSILGCCFYGVGIIFGIVALVLANTDMKLYLKNPEDYSNYPNLNIGRILSMIGIGLSMFALAFFIYFLSLGPEGMKAFEENLRVKAEQQQNDE